MGRDRAWFDFDKAGFTKEDLLLVIRWIKLQVGWRAGYSEHSCDSRPCCSSTTSRKSSFWPGKSCADATVTTRSAAADALLDLGQKLKTGG